jgi:hypothetical protein
MARQQGDRQSRSFAGSTATATRTATLELCGPAEIPTRATYRLLLMRGLDAAEAANLTAYLCGIDVNGTPWSIGEVNRLLFLRSLARSGRWDAGNAATPPQDWPAAA